MSFGIGIITKAADMQLFKQWVGQHLRLQYCPGYLDTLSSQAIPDVLVRTFYVLIFHMQAIAKLREKWRKKRGKE
jgi:hypothetical protein